jgi:hypothetical protein
VVVTLDCFDIDEVDGQLALIVGLAKGLRCIDFRAEDVEDILITL